MQLIADLHIHSRFAYATSKSLTLRELGTWATRKGIGLMATGDWTHPIWFSELNTELLPVADGVYVRKEDPNGPRFVLGTELSCVYRHGGRVRRVHHLVFAPSLEVCARVSKELELRGTQLHTDGRPTLALSSKQLLELLLEIDPRIVLVPAHAWTPWFGVLGSRSGYDSLEECFEDLAPHVTAVETGLSADPAMCWSAADPGSRVVVSFSDAHSAPKLGREATVLEGKGEFAYESLRGVLRGEGAWQVAYTLEYFPEEGKYHWSGHRSCNIFQSPEVDRERGVMCLVCGKPLTVGVETRTELLSPTPAAKIVRDPDALGRRFVEDPLGTRLPYLSVVPLLEVLQEVHASPTKAKRQYAALVAGEVTEFYLLTEAPLEELTQKGGEGLAAAIAKVRRREVELVPGYDGVFGQVHVSI